MGLKNIFQKAREMTMSREAKLDAAYKKCVPAEFSGLLLAGGMGETERVIDSIAGLLGHDMQKAGVQDYTDLLTIYVQIVKDYLIDGKKLHDVRADLLRAYEAFLKVDNIGRVVAFCVLHAGDNTFFMTADDAEEQLTAMADSIAAEEQA